MEEKAHHVSKNVKYYWIFNMVIGGFFLWLIVSLISVTLFPNEFLGMHKNIFPLLFLIIYLIIIVIYWIWLGIVYENFVYYLTDDEIIIKSGVFKVDRIVIPFDKVQNVNVTRSVLERLLNIATIKIETAGGNEEHAEGTLEGVENFAELANEIIRKMELKKTKKEEKKETIDKNTENYKKLEKLEKLDELLEEIAFIKTELKRLRKEIKKKKEAFVPMISEFEFEKIEKNKKRSHKKKK